MKFSISKDNILEELQLLKGIVEKRNTMPILANFLLPFLGIQFMNLFRSGLDAVEEHLSAMCLRALVPAFPSRRNRSETLC
jgi:hypothetical protein